MARGAVFSQTVFRASKSVENDQHRFAPTAESIAPTRIAFIGTSSTASASELVINSMLPYLGTNMTPVGGLARDKISRFRFTRRVEETAFDFGGEEGGEGVHDGRTQTG